MQLINSNAGVVRPSRCKKTSPQTHVSEFDKLYGKYNFNKSDVVEAPCVEAPCEEGKKQEGERQEGEVKQPRTREEKRQARRNALSLEKDATDKECYEKELSQKKAYHANIRNTRSNCMNSLKSELIHRILQEMRACNLISDNMMKYYTTNPSEWAQTKRILFTGGVRAYDIEDEDSSETKTLSRKFSCSSGGSYLTNVDRTWSYYYTLLDELYIPPHVIHIATESPFHETEWYKTFMNCLTQKTSTHRT